jgi:hypothetical protein
VEAVAGAKQGDHRRNGHDQSRVTLAVVAVDGDRFF